MQEIALRRKKKKFNLYSFWWRCRIVIFLHCMYNACCITMLTSYNAVLYIRGLNLTILHTFLYTLFGVTHICIHTVWDNTFLYTLFKIRHFLLHTLNIQTDLNTHYYTHCLTLLILIHTDFHTHSDSHCLMLNTFVYTLFDITHFLIHTVWHYTFLYRLTFTHILIYIVWHYTDSYTHSLTLHRFLYTLFDITQVLIYTLTLHRF